MPTDLPSDFRRPVPSKAPASATFSPKESSMTPIRSVLAGLLLVAGLAPAQLVAFHRSSSGSGNVTEMKPDIKIKNTGTSSVDLSKITIDYLFYENGISAASLVPACYYVSPSQCPDMSIDIASIPLQTNGSKSANFRARIAFASGSLAAGQELLMQWGIHGQGWTHFFKESDDWSYTSNNGQYNPAPGIVVANPGPPGMTLPMTWNGTAASLPATTANGGTMRSSTADAVSVYDGTSWAVVAQGVAGTKGPTGNQGPQGNPGPTGLTGLDGLPGGTGPTGATGPTGLPGLQGPAGDAGIQGPAVDLTAQATRLATLQATVAAFRPKFPAQAVSLAVTSAYSLVLRQDGSVWGSGDRRVFESGTPGIQTTPILAMTDAQAVGAGFYLKLDGSLWGMSLSAPPTKLMDGVKAAAMGGNFLLMLKIDGTLWVQGGNDYGQFGNGTTTSSSTPIQVNSNVAAIAAGEYHSLIIKTDGTLWTTGRNQNGQLGDGSTIDRSTPVQIATGVKAAAAGIWHTLFLKQDGTVWGAGWNDNGQLGSFRGLLMLTPEQLATGVQRISVGYFSAFSLILKTDGTLQGTGENYEGEIGDGTQNTVYGFKTIATGVKTMANGLYTTMFIKTDGSVWGTGRNVEGEFGNGTTNSSLVPVRLPY